ncbi:MAG: hypothetical protein ABW252_21815 [Polyangiales bacterium]
MEQARSADVVGEAPSARETSLPAAIPSANAQAQTASVHVDVGEVSVRTRAPRNTEAEGFFGADNDDQLRKALLEGRIVKVEKGRGGRSLGFKVQLDTNEKAYFKADQTFSAANWFGEVASYHLDRMLGLGRVPLVVSRTFPWSILSPAAGNDFRRSEIIMKDGIVQGAIVAWVEGQLVKLPHQPGWERWVRVQHWSSSAITPFQRPSVWKKQIDGRLVKSEPDKSALRPEPDREDRASELSDLIVFDYLTRNQDRWGGENANVLIRGLHGPLVFLDNGASFEPGAAQPSLMEARLHALQRFRRKTIQAVRAFDLERFKARLATEPLQPVLNDAQIAGLVTRRKALLEWVAHNESTHGEAIWAWE